MTELPTEDFLEWARVRGIDLDPVYLPPKCLVHIDAAAESRWWNFPARARDLSRFLSHLLIGMEPWAACCVWPRGGEWLDVSTPHNRLEAVRQLVAAGPTIPYGLQGAVKYSADEVAHLVALVSARALSGWNVRDDRFVVPDHGRYILHTDHHRVVHVSALYGPDLLRLIQHMEAGGYKLPEEPLDETFKRPNWMA